MGLPKIDVPTYKTTIPSTQKQITIRPFLVKEEKILLTALASEDIEQIAEATKQIVANCIITQGVDVEKLEIFDLEFLILQLRIHSVGEKTKIRFLPIQGSSCKECSKHRDVEIDLREASIEKSPNHTNKIELTDKIGLIMSYPNAKMLPKIEVAKTKDDVSEYFKIIWDCVDAVYDENVITSNKDVSVKEGLDFLESLNSEQFSKIENFFVTMPKLKQTVKIKCKECDFEQNYVMSGLDNFFG